jgi:hypothetical protein
MTTQIKTEVAPPYVAYKTFSNFIASLRESGLPNRIDRSVLDGMSGANQSNIISTLKFLGLINDAGVPSDAMKHLVTDPKTEKATLAMLLEKKYHFVFNGGFDIKAATESQISEKFREHNVTGSTVDKCVSFFTLLCAAAGVQLSPHLKSKRGGAGKPRKPYKKREKSDRQNNDTPPPAQQPAQKSISELLLEKFPTFDPKWDADTAKKWFENFGELMKSAKKSDGGEHGQK